MARHNTGRHSAPEAAAAPDLAVPAPGTRRAARAQAEAETVHRITGTGALGLPSPAVRTLRVGVLGAVIAGTGAFTFSQVAVDQADASQVDLNAAAESGTLALRSGDAASRSQIAGRLALEADGARTFSVVADGATQDVTSTAPTLGEALAEAGVVVGADDLVSAPLSGGVPDGRVEITRVTTQNVTEEAVEQFQTVEKEDPTLAEGQREVETKGVNGVSSNTYTVKKAGDQEVSRELVASVVATVKADEVVRVGTKAAVAEPSVEAAAPAGALATASGDPRSIGRELAAARGWGASQFQCLDSLWTKESGWNTHADNPSSSAYGIPQALPGSKMATVGADWRTNPATQITWGLNYISGRYGTPCGAWGHSKSVGWY
ncbi:G5 domain-containing protein [Georgenia sp. SYP-B2076]|uniref:aggregation-promoting factor C-terminal-like domain-containing protein n=1 Tax=Georgenia sp. SYP-B2076 TaxID=2495881 RepID=UPI00197A9F3F|nr:G5 domain-containing protein [Georgenia sp. SYP-B2076]